MDFDRDKKYECTALGVKVTSADGSFVYLPPWKRPELEPVVWQNKLSLDQMIGIFCLCFVFVASGFSLKLMAYIGGIWAIVVSWRWLHKRAPVTADIIFAIFGILLLALLSAGRGRRRGRW